MEKLTFQEEEVMLIVWRLGEGVIKDFIQEMDEPRPPYTTVASIVKNLERKGFVTARRYGNMKMTTRPVSCPGWCATILRIPTRRWSRSLPRSRRFRQRS